MSNSTAALPRMLLWAVATLVLMAAALLVQSVWPHSLPAVTLYKAHLMALGGWGGYWLDRALAPYARPHTYLDDEAPVEPEPEANFGETLVTGLMPTHEFSQAMLRRAIIVAACLVCVGLGA